MGHLEAILERWFNEVFTEMAYEANTLEKPQNINLVLQKSMRNGSEEEVIYS